MVGTAAYMSPEQARGELVDHRTDVWSLGVVLYEMLTGTRPFDASYESAMIYRIINEEPVAPHLLRPDLPPDVETVVLQALRKDPTNRHQRTRDIADALRRPDEHPGRAGAPKRRTVLRAAAVLVVLCLAGAGLYLTLPPDEAYSSVAVLPFANPGGDPALDYLCDGLSESLINSLSRLPDLKVKSLSAVMRYKDKELDLPAIADELDVRAIVTGRATLRGDSLSIVMELVDATDNSHLWGDRWESALSDVLSFQTAIAHAVPEGLRLRLTRDDQARLTRGYSSSKEANLLYLKGRYYWNRRTPDDIRRAIEHFDRALSVDPSSALAYAGLADAYNLLGSIQYAALPPAVSMPRARSAAIRALEIDDELAEAHVSLGHVELFFNWDLKSAEHEFSRAIDLNPNYATAHQWYGDCLMLLNRKEEALLEKRTALELDPLSLVITLDLGTAQYYWRDYHAAVEQCRRTLEMDPTFLMARLLLGRSYVQMKRLDQAIAEFTALRDAVPSLTLPASLLGHALGVAGRKAEAEQVLEHLTELSRNKYVPAHEFAAVHLGLGRTREALCWLRKAYEERSGLMVYLTVEPALDPLRREPDFVALARDVERGAHNRGEGPDVTPMRGR
jgi:serine/threonine-protein kinase